jgi:hypothetical protein
MPTDLGTGFLPFSAIKAESFFNKVVASLPRRPSADATKGAKSADAAQGKARGVPSFSHVLGLPMLLCGVLWSGLTWRQH